MEIPGDTTWNNLVNLSTLKGILVQMEKKLHLQLKMVGLNGNIKMIRHGII